MSNTLGLLRDILLNGLLVCLLFQLFFAHRVDRIREFLRQRHKGFLRKRYLAAVIGALRGKADSTDTYVIALIPIALLAGFSYWTKYMIAETELTLIEMNSDVTGMQLNQKKDEDGIASLSKELELRIELGDEYPEESPKQRLLNMRQRLDELTQKVRDFRGKVRETTARYEAFKKSSRWKLTLSSIVSTVTLVLCYLGIFLWQPFVVMRRQFASELSRFTLRIQGLSSKAELAELALLESQVSDEQSLRTFVEKATQIASRHRVEALVSTFDLWQSENVKTHEGDEQA